MALCGQAIDSNHNLNSRITLIMMLIIMLIMMLIIIIIIIVTSNELNDSVVRKASVTNGLFDK